MTPRTPNLIQNRLSLVGSALALVSFLFLLAFLIIDWTQPVPNPYLGVFTWLIFPVFLVLGLLLIPAGMFREHRRRRHLTPEEIQARRWPRIDLNDPRHRQILAAAGGAVVLVLIFIPLTGYQAYQFTESTTFCGQVCHEVMRPEFTAYQNSPHARVSCAACHVGPGASWFVKSKLSGARQVFAVTFNTYQKPIPGPIEDLRPARETCEQCHWPEKFFGAKLKTFTHFGSDEVNTRREIQMLIKIGGGSPQAGPSTGIHWHMNIANEVHYIPRDSLRQEIPWVQIRDQQGRVTVYHSAENPLTPEEISHAEKRLMDCMDCHDRPTHIYKSPQRAVDEALLLGRISPALPSIKQQAVEVLAAEYPTTPAAVDSIATRLAGFYQTQHPDLFRGRELEVRQAIAAVQHLYQQNIFPEMRVNWRTYPDNLGHQTFPGCFRCHDGKHVSEDGRVITRDCEACHVLLSQTEGVAATPAQALTPEKGQPFVHPVDLGVPPEELVCSDCHTGGP